jgi:hypothetical protein
MLELVLLPTLMDKLISLVTTRKQYNKALFDNLVQPAFKDFEQVHADYISSLEHYHARLSDKSFAMNLDHPIFDELEMDSVKTAHFRTKLTSFNPHKGAKQLAPFLVALNSYLHGIASFNNYPGLANAIVTDPRSLSREDLKPLMIANLARESELLENRVNIYQSDPMRFVLRRILVGFDAPIYEESQYKEDLDLIMGANEYMVTTDDERRRACAYIIAGLMQGFQFSFSFVNTEYANLRDHLAL